MSGTSTWPGPEPSCCMRGWNWWNGSAPTSGAPTRSSPTGPRKRGPSTVPRCRAPWRTTAPCRLPLPCPALPPAKPAGPAEDLRQLSVDELTERYVQAFASSRRKELERGISLVGPHRDELELILGDGPREGLCLAW